jgi:anti-anti-sigma factor
MDLRRVSDDEQALRLQLVGRVVQDDLDPERDPLDALLGDRPRDRPVLVNLAKAEYIDSSGLAWVLVWHKRLREVGGKLVLHSIPVHVMETLQILRMDLVLYLARDESAALMLARGESG